MKLLSIFFNCAFFVSLVISSLAISSENTPANSDQKEIVKKAILAAEFCYHWAGEIGDQTPERNKEIEAGIKADCPTAKKLIEEALSMLPSNKELHEHALKLTFDDENKLNGVIQK